MVVLDTGVTGTTTVLAAHTAIAALREARWRVATAESCTGGLLAGALTEIAGSSAIIEGGFVTYSNAAKTALLGVPADLIERVGAVSPEVARAMAEGALEALAGADLALSITGIAGPDGGSPEKPVGLVYLGRARRGLAAEVRECRFSGSRAQIRTLTVLTALAWIAQAASQAAPDTPWP